jgi:hypothetical protein
MDLRATRPVRAEPHRLIPAVLIPPRSTENARQVREFMEKALISCFESILTKAAKSARIVERGWNEKPDGKTVVKRSEVQWTTS